MTKRILSAALALALALSLAVPAFAEEESPFTDVPAGHWAYEAIAQAKEEGIIIGVGDGVFAPGKSLTAAQFAAIVAQAFYWRPLREAERSLAGEGQDPDAPWYALYQKTVEQAGLMKGTGVEDWSAPMTRYQMAQMLYNIAVDKGLEAPAAGSAAIADLGQVPEQYKEAVKSAYSLKLLSGIDEKGTFAGDKPLARAQAAVVFAKLDQALEAKDGPMERTLDKAERNARQYSFLSTTFTRCPGKLGTAYSVSQGGTPHGSSGYLRYVSLDGTEQDIRALLPEGYIYGSIWSFPATDIQFDETGEKLSFVTPVQEYPEDSTSPSGYRYGRNWGDTRIVVNVVTGKMESMEPLTPFDLTEWKVVSEPGSPLSNPTPGLSVEIKNNTGESVTTRPYVYSCGYPYAGMFTVADQNSVSIAHLSTLISGPEFLASDYGKAFSALRGLSVGDAREQVGRYLQVEHNGRPVAGTFDADYAGLDFKDLWFVQEGDYAVMRFNFDRPVELKEGDTLTVRLGLPRE